MSYGFILDIALILLTTKLFGIAAKRIHMPQVVGAIIAGVVFGPAGLNILHATDYLSHLSELGVIVIMFTAGLETDLVELKRVGKSGFLVAFMGVIIPLIGGVLFGLAFNHGHNDSQALLENIFIGVVLTATSVSITVETLKEMGRLSTVTGNTILAAALIDDILGLICLTIATSISGGSSSNISIVILKILLFFVVAGIVSLLAFKFTSWYSKTKEGASMRRFPVIAFVFCLFMAYGAEHFFGVAAIIGAFVAGLSLSSTNQASYIQSRFDPLSFLFLTPMFFANIGIDMDLSNMNVSMLFATVVLTLIAVFTKLVGCGIGAKISGLNFRESIQVGVGMISRGEVALIVASNGFALGVLSTNFYSSIVIMIVVTTIITPILLKIVYRDVDKNAALHSSGLLNRREMVDEIESVNQHLLRAEHERIRKDFTQSINCWGKDPDNSSSRDGNDDESAK